MLLNQDPRRKKRSIFAHRFSAESEKVRSKVFGIVAALDVIEGHIGQFSAFLVGDGKVLEDGWYRMASQMLAINPLRMSKAVILTGPVNHPITDLLHIQSVRSGYLLPIWWQSPQTTCNMEKKLNPVLSCELFLRRFSLGREAARGARG